MLRILDSEGHRWNLGIGSEMDSLLVCVLLATVSNWKHNLGCSCSFWICKGKKGRHWWCHHHYTCTRFDTVAGLAVIINTSEVWCWLPLPYMSHWKQTISQNLLELRWQVLYFTEQDSVLSMKPFRMIVDHAIQLRFMICYYVMAQKVNRLCAYCWLLGDLWTPYKLQNAKYLWSPDRHMWSVWRRGCKLVGSELAYSSYMPKIVLILKFKIVLLFLISSEYMNIWKWQFQYRPTRYISSVAEPLMSLKFASS